MTTIRYIKGDATSPQSKGRKIVCHIVNDLGKWGKGFVLAVSARWPEVEKAYRWWYKNKAEHSGLDFGIGMTQDKFELGGVQSVMVQPDIVVCNMVGQHGVRGGFTRSSSGPPVRYEAIALCLVRVVVSARQFHASVHMPRIGCGLAGGKWEKVEPLIQQTLCDADVDVTVYDFDD